MKSVSAFAPANISCVFKIHSNENPKNAGSTGIGFTLDKGVTVSASKAKKQEILFNNNLINFPTVQMVLQELTSEPLKIDIQTELLLGSGFGLSGASALATAYAVNVLLSLGKTQKELALLAHTADVKNKTGLGDVTNQYFGGFLVKFVPSAEFVVERFGINNTSVYCRIFGQLSTNTVLSNNVLKQTINQAADIALSKIKKMLSYKKSIRFEDVIDISEEYAFTSGLLQDSQVKNVIASIKNQGGHASMIMLGNAVFADMPFPSSSQYTITKKGAHLV